MKKNRRFGIRENMSQTRYEANLVGCLSVQNFVVIDPKLFQEFLSEKNSKPRNSSRIPIGLPGGKTADFAY